ncbi:class II glutamine amidotransferase [Bacteriovoracaceae bacterium]|nr:class II glutamine amidotransferase [Bacteriovoracaceae bacterium]
MCRIFGFRSVLFSQVHSSLVSADNALVNQSTRHPDGWGVAYYIGQTPHLIKSTQSAIDCHIFQKISGVVSSQSVVAHVRNATEGELSILNTHPFQYGKWVFAHNGNIKNLAKHKDKLLALISPEIKRFILGDTDSEIIFFILLSQIKKRTCLESPTITNQEFSDLIRNGLQSIVDLIGKLTDDDAGLPTENYLTFVLTNGSYMFGVQAGQPLYYSTYKNYCPERDTCANFNDTCENLTTTGAINHLILSSEPLQGENIWIKLLPGEFVSVDDNMNLFKDQYILPFN